MALTPAVPTLFFLFMTRIGVEHEEVWSRFFAGADGATSKYVALVHCYEGCAPNFTSHPELFHAIPTVGSQHCENLVSPMNAVLEAALRWAPRGGGGSDGDKFIFLSESTLPLKSFGYVWRELIAKRAGQSSFCVEPRSMWARLGPWLVPKTQQWSILSRRHAEMATARSVAEMWDDAAGWTQRHGCLDEYWHFFFVFGALNDTGPRAELEGFSTGGLELGAPSAGAGSDQLQGDCDTFAAWYDDQYCSLDVLIPEETRPLCRNGFTELKQRLSSVSALGGLSTGRAAEILHVDARALEALHASPFLFGRKFAPSLSLPTGAPLAEAFGEHAFRS